jgi:hypothetical protein
MGYVEARVEPDPDSVTDIVLQEKDIEDPIPIRYMDGVFGELEPPRSRFARQ